MAWLGQINPSCYLKQKQSCMFGWIFFFYMSLTYTCSQHPWTSRTCQHVNGLVVWIIRTGSPVKLCNRNLWWYTIMLFSTCWGEEPLMVQSFHKSSLEWHLHLLRRTGKISSLLLYWLLVVFVCFYIHMWGTTVVGPEQLWPCTWPRTFCSRAGHNFLFFNS